MDYRARQKKLRGEMARAKVDGVLIGHLPNVRYLTEFTGSSAWLAITEKSAVLFTDGRYTVQAREEVRDARVVIAKGAVMAAAARWAGEQRLKTIGIEGEHVSVAARDQLAKMLPKQSRLRALAGTVERLRMTKEGEEIEQIRAAVLLGSSLLEGVLRFIRPGAAESEVAGELEHAARRAGAEGMSFETIVAGGARSAMPHARASAQALPNRGFVILDFGVILAGYCSDMTRTVHVGRATGRVREMYEVVREAQQAGLEAVRPGVTAGEVDQATRRLLKKAGWAKYFTHSTGHGVGLEIHEPPRLGTGQTELLQPGMVVTIEPGIYVPGEGGVRIEDMVVVTAAGAEILTPTTKELLSL